MCITCKWVLMLLNRSVHLHFVSVVPRLQSSFFMGADILVRLGAQLDTVNPRTVVPGKSWEPSPVSWSNTYVIQTDYPPGLSCSQWSGHNHSPADHRSLCPPHTHQGTKDEQHPSILPTPGSSFFELNLTVCLAPPWVEQPLNICISPKPDVRPSPSKSLETTGIVDWQILSWLWTDSARHRWTAPILVRRWKYKRCPVHPNPWPLLHFHRLTWRWPVSTPLTPPLSLSSLLVSSSLSLPITC